PPAWPLNFLQNLARYVFSSGNAFDERHHMTLNGPIAIGEQTDITAIVLLQDQQLKEMDTRNGHVKFLQIVGLCGDEYELIQAGYFDPIASRVSELAPLSITDIFRPSILEDESVRNEITSEKPNVSQSEVFGTIAEWKESEDQLEVRIGATVVAQLKSLMSGRLTEGEPIAVYGKGTGIVFEPGEIVAWRHEEPLMLISLSHEAVMYFADSLQPVRGIYQCVSCPSLSIHVVPVEIKDRDGEVTDTVG
ncbi:MAG: suppressor of fused domain protein, partial [Planctomycetota bacterium]